MAAGDYQVAKELAEELGFSVNGSTAVEDGGLPMIVVSNRHLRNIADEAWEILVASNSPPCVFQRGHLLVQIIRDDKGRPVIRALDKAAFTGILDRVADFMKVTADGLVPARPPTDVVADMMAARELPMPLFRGIIHAPIFAPSGLLVTQPGYQPETGYFLELGANRTIPEVPHQPEDAAVKKALGLFLDDLLVDFRFASDADKAHAFAVILLPFVRELIDGPTPLHMIESPTPGSGKGLLADVLTIPAVGRGPTVMTEGRDEDEWRKRITARLIEGPQFILIDNIRSGLDSAALSGALTAETWQDRVLGHSRTVALPVTCVWLATGNNPSLSMEMARRTPSIRLDTGMERPWERTGFKHKNLRRWAWQHRGELIWAALVLIQAWIAKGRPAGTKSLGSYESWSEVIGGILETVGVPGFLDNMARLYAAADSDTTAWGQFCQVWWNALKDQPVGADQLFTLATTNHLLLNVWGGHISHGARTRFGIALSKMRDRVVGEFCIQRAEPDSHTKAPRYQLQQVAGGAGGSGGSGNHSKPGAQKNTAEVNQSEPFDKNPERVPNPPQGPATPREEED